MTAIDTSPYLSGNYAPVTEEVTAFDLPVIGELPDRAQRALPAQRPEPDGSRSTRRPTTGSSATAWSTASGSATGKAEWYRNRYVGSAADQRPPRHRPTSPAATGTAATVGPNTNVGGFAGTTWAMVEAGGCPVELTYELDTVGRNDFYGTLPGAFTAHPKVDPATGEMHAMVYAWAQWMDHVQYVVVGTDGRVRHTLDIPLPGMTMLHDMSLTERYAVVYDQPCTVDFDLAFAGRFPFRWNPDYGNRVGLLPARGRGADDIVWIDVPIGYSFHPMNAYDTPDGARRDRPVQLRPMFDRDILGPFGDGGWRGSSAGSSTRSGARRRSPSIDDTPNEFPRHRGSLTAKPVPLRLLRLALDRSDAGLADAQARPADRRAVGVRPRAGPRRRRAGVRRPPGRHRRGRRLAGHVRARPRRRHGRVRRDRRPGLRPRVRRPGAAPPAGAVRLPRQLGQRPGGCSARLSRL